MICLYLLYTPCISFSTNNLLAHCFISSWQFCGNSASIFFVRNLERQKQRHLLVVSKVCRLDIGEPDYVCTTHMMNQCYRFPIFQAVPGLKKVIKHLSKIQAVTYTGDEGQAVICLNFSHTPINANSC